MTRSRAWLMRAASFVLAAVAALVAVPVTAASASPVTPPQVLMILLDTNTSIPTPGLVAERTAALADVRALPSGVEVGLIAFGNRWHLALSPTTDRQRLAAALAAAVPVGGTSAGIRGALSGALSAVARLGAASRSRLLVLSDAERLSAHLRLQAAIPTDLVTWQYDGDDHPAALQALASASGGRVVAPASAAALAAGFTAVEAPAASPALAPPPAATQWPLTLLVLLAGVFLVLLVVVLVGMSSLHQIDRSRQLAQRLERYGARHSAAPPEEEGRAARTVLAWGTRLLRTSSAEPRLAVRLDLAGISRRPAEWAVLSAAACALLAAGLTVLSRNPAIGVLAGLLVGWLGMHFFLSFRISRRRAAFSEQLPDVLQLLAGSLQAGFSLPQALDAVVREGTQPAAMEFSRALAETRIGIDLAAALDQVADRMESADLRWTVMAIRIQREVGGNLAEVLRNTMDTMRERAYLRRHVRALSAEGRLSAYILIALPLLVGTWLFISNGGYMRPLYTTVFGLLMLVGGSVLMVAGSFWMRNLIKMEV